MARTTGTKPPSAEECRLVRQAKAEAFDANVAGVQHAPADKQAKLFWSVASLWFAAAVAAQNRFRFLAWGSYLNRAKEWAKMALDADALG